MSTRRGKITSAGIAKDPNHPSKQLLKQVAMELFASRGLDGVGIREIVAKAGFKNVASVRYHFGTKSDLARAIVVDGITEAEEWRREKLDRMEAAGNVEVRELLRVMVGPVAEDRMSHVFIRFMGQIMMNNREFSPRVIDPDLVRSVDRCRRHFQRLLKGMPRALIDERFEFLNMYLLYCIASRGIEMERSGASSIWGEPSVLEHFLDTAQALLCAPVSEITTVQRRREMARLRRSRALPRSRRSLPN